MASIRKRSNAWQVRIQRNNHPDISKTFKTHTEAVAWARAIEHEIDTGSTPRINPNATLGELLVRYQANITPAKKGASVEHYRIAKWLRHPLSLKEISTINSVSLSKWRDESIVKGTAPNTIRLELAVISHLFNIARAEWGFSHLENPADGFRLPKLPKGRVRRVDKHELERIAECTDSLLLPLIMTIAVETAMRRGEIAALRWEYVCLKTCTVLLPDTKNGDTRKVPLSTLVAKILKSLPRAAEGSVFNITDHAISVAFTRACKRAKVDGLHFHDLRHEAISRLFERGFSLPEVATISGHRTWAMLSRYTHLKAQDLVKRLG